VAAEPAVELVRLPGAALVDEDQIAIPAQGLPAAKPASVVIASPGPPPRKNKGSGCGVVASAGRTTTLRWSFRPAFAARFSQTSWRPQKASTSPFSPGILHGARREA